MADLYPKKESKEFPLKYNKPAAQFCAQKHNPVPERKVL